MDYVHNYVLYVYTCTLYVTIMYMYTICHYIHVYFVIWTYNLLFLMSYYMELIIWTYNFVFLMSICVCMCCLYILYMYI